MSTRGAAAIVLFLELFWLGCAGHEARTKMALEALDQGNPKQALVELNQELKVDSSEVLPALEGDNSLLLLDRGSVLLSLDDYKLSERDFGAADKAIDVLDFSANATDDLGKYLFSDDAGPYRAPSYEKLMVNTVNMMNYLAQGDLTGAKVEARRLAIMQKYIKDHQEETALLGLGSLLAGFAFEKSGNANEALLYYDEALHYAQYASLKDPLRVLTHGESKTPGIDALVAGAGPLPSVEETGEGEVLIVIGYGRVPQKIPNRIPIGLALTMVAGNIHPTNAAKANALAAKGLVTWINYPTLGKARGTYSIPTLTVNDESRFMEEALDVETEVRKDWERKEPSIITSAITRMITRVAAGEIAQGATKAGGGGDVVGLLVGLATSATLSAVDTPDTRCWSTLPSRFAIARFRVPAGDHWIQLGARGMSKRHKVTVNKGGWVFVPMLALR